MIPPEHIATMREALQTWSEMLERRANTVERHGVAGTTYRKHIAEIDAALAYLDTLPTALDAANQRVQELEASFDLRHDSDMRAIKQWQEATGEELKWPNHADLCVWLMQRIAELEAREASLQVLANELARRLEEAQLAEQWQPLPNGRYESQHEGSFVFVEGEWIQVNERILGNTDMVDVAEADIALPDNLRLCRRVREGGQ